LSIFVLSSPILNKKIPCPPKNCCVVSRICPFPFLSAHFFIPYLHDYPLNKDGLLTAELVRRSFEYQNRAFRFFIQAILWRRSFLHKLAERLPGASKPPTPTHQTSEEAKTPLNNKFSDYEWLFSDSVLSTVRDELEDQERQIAHMLSASPAPGNTHA
jgi:hypothetical protein